MVETIMEAVEVVALFSKGTVIPLSFDWRGRDYNVEKVHYKWKDKKGEETVLFFSVSASANVYEIAFYSKNLKWLLNGVYVEG